MSEDRQKHVHEHEEPEADATVEDDDVEAHQFAAYAKHPHGDDERERHWGKD